MRAWSPSVACLNGLQLVNNVRRRVAEPQHMQQLPDVYDNHTRYHGNKRTDYS